MKYLSALVALCLSSSVALAAPIDVPLDAWYTPTVSAFVDKGYLSENATFRPSDRATRGEFIDLMVSLLGGVKHGPFSGESFDDVTTTHQFYEAFEEAGVQGWMKGVGSCYGSHPCNGNPDERINRAEAAALLMRAFNLQAANDIPSFDDNAPNQWFTEHIKGATSLCVLRGDEGSKRVRPADNMNRAEMVVMLSRSLQRENYPNCSAGATRPTLPEAPQRGTKAVEKNSQKVIEGMKMMLGMKNDNQKSMVEYAANYSGVTRQQLDALLKIHNTKLTEFGRLVQIYSERKLTITESANQTLLMGEMSAISAQFTSVMTSSKGDFSPIGPDPLAKTFSDAYNNSKLYLEGTMKNAETMPPDLAYAIYEALKPYPSYLHQMGTLSNKASNKTLTVQEGQMFNSAMQGTLNILNKVGSLIKSYKSSYSPSLAPSYSPSYSQPAQSHQQMCDEMVARAAVNGSSGSSGTWSQLYNAGCSTLEQFCTSFIISNVPLPAACK